MIIKIIQSIDAIQNILYGINKDLVCKKKDIKCNNIIKRHRNV